MCLNVVNEHAQCVFFLLLRHQAEVKGKRLASLRAAVVTASAALQGSVG